MLVLAQDFRVFSPWFYALRSLGEAEPCGGEDRE